MVCIPILVFKQTITYRLIYLTSIINSADIGKKLNYKKKKNYYCYYHTGSLKILNPYYKCKQSIGILLNIPLCQFVFKTKHLLNK